MNPTPKRTWRLRQAAAIAASVGTILVAVLGGVWAASAERAEGRQQTERNCRRLDDHEDRLRTIERDLAQIAADVRWIRREMEED